MERTHAVPRPSARFRWRIGPASHATRRWDRPALTRVLALSFVSLMVLLGGIVGLVELRLGTASNGAASSSSAPVHALLDLIYPGNLTLRYVGSTNGYFGPEVLPYCGSSTPCTLGPGDRLSAAPGSLIHWRFALNDLDAVQGHWVQVVTVDGPFQLEDVYPELPLELGASTGSTVIQLTLLTPAHPGAYLLSVAATTFD